MVVSDWTPPDDYGVICTVNRQYVYVSHETLDKVRSMVRDRREKPSKEFTDFIEFDDVVGSTVMLRPSQIECLWDSTPEIRERDRLMHAHWKANRPYDDD